MRVQEVPLSDDPEQLRLDLEDARARLDGIQRAILERDEANDAIAKRENGRKPTQARKET